MKRYLYISSCVVCFSLLLAIGHDHALTANKPSTTPSNQPLKVLGVKLNTAKSQPKASWLDGLEVELENTSGKTISYFVVYVEVPVVPEKAPLRIPFQFGQAPVPNAKSGKFEVFQPGAKLNLIASKSVCDGIRKNLVNSGRVPASAKDIQTDIDFVIFQDKTAWSDGQLHYPEPASPMRWITAEEVARRNSLENRAIAMTYSKASYKSSSRPQTCFRHIGFEMIPCCGELYVGSKLFTDDPNGHSQPNLVEACCSPGDCCSYYEVQGCS